MVARYVYQQLPPGRYFRLLRVSAGQLGDLAQQLDLVEYELDDCPSYRTMSYVWGDPERSEHSITIGGKVLGITENLSRALPNIFRQCYEGFLWCDQLCIDQDNVDERGVQVSLMADIYRNALGVVIWLDLENSVADELCKCMENLGLSNNGFIWTESTEEIQPYGGNSKQQGLALRLKDWINQELHRAGDAMFSTRANLGMSSLHTINASAEEDMELETVIGSPFCSSLMAALDSFLNHAWLTRIWVVQEALLSREVITCLGTRSCSLQNLARLVVAAHRVFRRTNWSPFDSRGYRLLVYLMNWCFAEESDRSLYELLCNLRTLTINSELKASDPRDLVYGMLALTDNCEPYDIIPDYSLSTELVFVNTARAIIETRNDLQILLVCDGAKLNDQARKRNDTTKPPRQCSLPTWVPDWSRKLERYTIYPGRKLPPPPRSDLPIATRVHELYTRGKSIDTIANTMPGVFAALRGWLVCILVHEGVYEPRGKKFNNCMDPITRHAHLRRLLGNISRGAAQLDDTQLFRAWAVWALTEPGARVWSLVELRSNLEDPLREVLSAFTALSSPYRCETSEEHATDRNDDDPWSDVELSAIICEHGIRADKFCEVENCSLAKHRLLHTALPWDFFETLALTTNGKVVLTQDNVQAHDVVAVLRGFPAPIILRETNTGHYQYVTVSSYEDAFGGPSLRDWPEEEDEHIILV